MAPDRTFVWNELQRREAAELHGLDPESVIAVGAPHWDRFFRRKPSMSRDEFCQTFGFAADEPIVLKFSHVVAPDAPYFI